MYIRETLLTFKVFSIIFNTYRCIWYFRYSFVFYLASYNTIL